MKFNRAAAALAATFALAACARSKVAQEAEIWVDTSVPDSAASAIEIDDDDEEEIQVPLDEVPDVVLDAAQAAVPGLVIENVEFERGEDPRVYDVEGTVGDVEWEVEVTADGEVLEVEREDEDDDD